jgi:4-hydroxy-tetrahydrodipicolinate reductase
MLQAELLSLAKGVIENSKYTNWTPDKPTANQIHIEAKRIATVPGTQGNFNSTVDSISIEHTAHNREGFALGAIIAAEWIVGKQGTFTMKDVLELK